MKRYKQYLEPDSAYLLPRTTKFRSIHPFKDNSETCGQSQSEIGQSLENGDSSFSHLAESNHVDFLVGNSGEAEVDPACKVGGTSELHDGNDMVCSDVTEGNDNEAEVDEQNDTESSDAESDGEVSEVDESEESSEIDLDGVEGVAGQACTDDDLGSTFDENLNIPICRFLSITKAEVLLLMVTFVLKHNLAFVALLDLLKLINFIFCTSVLPTSKHMLNKVFKHFSQRTELHFLCTFCQSYVGSHKQEKERKEYVCPNCNKSNNTQALKSQSYFVTLPVDLQIRTHLESTTFRDKLNYRFSRAMPENGFGDIYDGEMYRELSRPGGILHSQYNLSYVFNSDGSPLYKASNTSIWPIQLAVNEIPPADRKKNMILAGLWHGKGEPRMDIFLQKFVEQAKKLATDGVTWLNNNILMKSKVVGLCCCVDSVARPLMQNTTQFNGYYGCGFCYHPGEYICGAIRYPVSEDQHADRNASEMIHDMEEATESGTCVRGVKGVSPLINLPYFDVVHGFVPDYMHCVLLGVTKQLSKLWLEEFGCDYYIGSPSDTRIINTRLSKIKPPQYISRLPRKIDERRYWKASEWRAWLLFYAIPCLKGVLESKYLCHFALLVQAVYLLLGDSISKAEVNKADLLLLEFVFRFQMLYGKKAMTFNVHLLNHLSVSVKNWGPLWAHSAFDFENGNGKLVKLVKNAKGAPLQIVNKFIMFKALPVVASMDTISVDTHDLCKSMTEPARLKSSHVVGDVCFLGTAVVSQLSLQEENALREIIHGLPGGMMYNIYSRLIVNSLVIHSTDYTRPVRSNDTVVCLKDRTFGVVTRIVTFSDGAAERCIVLLKDISLVNLPLLQNGRSRSFLPHILVCSSVNDDLRAVAPSEVLSKCIYINFTNENYICTFPNTNEQDI